MPQPTQRIDIFGPVGSDVTAAGVAQQLAAFDRSAPVLVRLNSDGGSVQEGIAIYNQLLAWPAGAEVEIVGWALSVATVIAMAGRIRRMHSTSLAMVHAPWLTATGNAGELRSTADLLDRVSVTMREAYSRTGQKPAVIDTWLDGADHWFTADQALALGLITEIVSDAADVATFANASGTRHPVPTHILERIKTMPSPAAHASNDAALAAAREEGIRAESQRRTDIVAAFAPFTSMEGMAEVQAACLANPRISVEDANQRILAQMGKGVTSAAAGRIHYTGDGNSDRDFMQGARDALLIRAGHRVSNPHPIARDLRHSSIVSIAEVMLSRLGMSPASRSPGDIIRAALTTSDFPTLLGNVASQSLRGGYTETLATHVAWTAEKELPNFQPTTLAMLSEGPDLLLKPEGGEYKHGNFNESGTSFALQVFGRIVSFTREALINDQLDAFSDIPRAHGAAARRLEADKVYGLLTGNPTLNDGVALFHASHGNLAGAGGAPSLATLGAARAAMRVQKGISNLTYIDPQPAFLIVPVVMETACEALLATLTSNAKGGDAAPAWVRNLTLVADPRLDAVSTTAWYLAADPKQIDTIVRAYLASAERPFLDEYEDKSTDAVNFKSRLDFCTGVVDFRGLYKNPGA